MKTLYELDTHRYPTGRTQQVGDRDPIPPGWTDQAPPADDSYRFVGGQWAQSPTRAEWLTRPQVLRQRKDTMRDQTDAELSRVYRAGFAYDFGANTSANQATLPDGTTEAAGVRTIQMRSPFDRSQWSAVAQAAKASIDAGNPGAAMRPIRTADNARVTVTAQEAFDAMMALQNWGGQKLEQAWDLKDQIESATSHADLDAITVEIT